MSILFYYIIIGLVLIMSWDSLLKKTQEEKYHFTNSERFCGIIFWPFWLVTFLFHYIKSMKDDK